MATLGQLVVELRASTASFASDLGKAKQLSFNSAKEMERSFKIMGAALVGALTAAAGAATALAIRSIDTADKMGKMAQAAGVTVEQFSGLAYAAKLSDVSTEQLSTSLIALSKNLEKSNQQTLEGKAAHSALGTLFKGNIPAFESTNAAFIEIAKRLEELPVGAQRTALAVQILGRSGAALLPMIKGLQDAIAEAKELGIVITQETAAKAEKFNDTITRLNTVIGAFGIQLAKALLDPLQKIAGSFLENAKNAGKMQENVQIVARSVELLARSVIGLGLAFKTAADGAAALVLSFQDIAALGTDEVIGRAAALARSAATESFASFRANLSAMLDEPIAKAKTFGQAMLEAASVKLGPIKEGAEAAAEGIERLGGSVERLNKGLQHGAKSEGFWDALRDAAKLKPQFPEIEPPQFPQGIPEIDLSSIETAAANVSDEILLLTQQVPVVTDKFRELRPLAAEIQSSIGDLFQQAVFHADSFVDALSRVAQAIAAMAFRMLVIQPLLNSLGGLFGGATSIGRGGIPLGLPVPGSLGVPALAAGGPIFGPSIVGEKGPELFFPRTVGTIVPNDKLFSGQSRQVNNTFHFHGVTDADSFNRSKGQIAAFIQRQLAIAHGRNG